MSIFNRKKQAPAVPVSLETVQKISISTLMHRFLLDSGMAEAQQLSTLLGLPPLEDAETETEASAERLHDLAPLAPMLAVFASVMSDSVVQYYLTMGDQKMEQDEADYMADLFAKVTMATLRGSITQLHDLGLISYAYDKESK